ncbi:cysteine peptidase family C39 domain-containing protein [uncultured Kordia sp.]|uniref:cysteine peptidase family C39 domain-containing protein n=1 Tax=uncultured Kordia sp. TaxID=507699 RepID=UPI00260DBA97|nr:cysteine peptidase family C39 domain-containing protein [uncultured Kordia sp.]
MEIIKILWYIFFMLFSSGEEEKVAETSFPVTLQTSAMECGPRCLQMISAYHGERYNINTLNKLCNLSEEGTSMGYIADAGELIGLHTLAVSVDYDTLLNEVPYPAMAHWRSRHFIVVYDVSKDSVWAADPAFGLVSYPKEQFIPAWTDSSPDKETGEGYLLLFEPTEKFYKQSTKQEAIRKANLKK